MDARILWVVFLCTAVQGRPQFQTGFLASPQFQGGFFGNQFVNRQGVFQQQQQQQQQQQGQEPIDPAEQQEILEQQRQQRLEALELQRQQRLEALELQQQAAIEQRQAAIEQQRLALEQQELLLEQQAEGIGQFQGNQNFAGTGFSNNGGFANIAGFQNQAGTGFSNNGGFINQAAFQNQAGFPSPRTSFAGSLGQGQIGAFSGINPNIGHGSFLAGQNAGGSAEFIHAAHPVLAAGVGSLAELGISTVQPGFTAGGSNVFSGQGASGAQFGVPGTSGFGVNFGNVAFGTPNAASLRLGGNQFGQTLVQAQTPQVLVHSVPVVVGVFNDTHANVAPHTHANTAGSTQQVSGSISSGTSATATTGVIASNSANVGTSASASVGSSSSGKTNQEAVRNSVQITQQRSGSNIKNTGVSSVNSAGSSRGTANLSRAREQVSINANTISGSSSTTKQVSKTTNQGSAQNTAKSISQQLNSAPVAQALVGNSQTQLSSRIGATELEGNKNINAIQNNEVTKSEASGISSASTTSTTASGSSSSDTLSANIVNPTATISTNTDSQAVSEALGSFAAIGAPSTRGSASTHSATTNQGATTAGTILTATNGATQSITTPQSPSTSTTNSVGTQSQSVATSSVRELLVLPVTNINSNTAQTLTQGITTNAGSNQRVVRVGDPVSVIPSVVRAQTLPIAQARSSASTQSSSSQLSSNTNTGISSGQLSSSQVTGASSSTTSASQVSRGGSTAIQTRTSETTETIQPTAQVQAAVTQSQAQSQSQGNSNAEAAAVQQIQTDASTGVSATAQSSQSSSSSLNANSAQISATPSPAATITPSFVAGNANLNSQASLSTQGQSAANTGITGLLSQANQVSFVPRAIIIVQQPNNIQSQQGNAFSTIQSTQLTNTLPQQGIGSSSQTINRRLGKIESDSSATTNTVHTSNDLSVSTSSSSSTANTATPASSEPVVGKGVTITSLGSSGSQGLVTTQVPITELKVQVSEGSSQSSDTSSNQSLQGSNGILLGQTAVVPSQSSTNTQSVTNFGLQSDNVNSRAGAGQTSTIQNSFVNTQVSTSGTGAQQSQTSNIQHQISAATQQQSPSSGQTRVVSVVSPSGSLTFLPESQATASKTLA